MTTQDKMELLKLAAQITAARVSSSIDDNRLFNGESTAKYLECVYRKLEELAQS